MPLDGELVLKIDEVLLIAVLILSSQDALQAAVLPKLTKLSMLPKLPKRDIRGPSLDDICEQRKPFEVPEDSMDALRYGK